MRGARGQIYTRVRLHARHGLDWSGARHTLAVSPLHAVLVGLSEIEGACGASPRAALRLFERVLPLNHKLPALVLLRAVTGELHTRITVPVVHVGSGCPSTLRRGGLGNAVRLHLRLRLGKALRLGLTSGIAVVAELLDFRVRSKLLMHSHGNAEHGADEEDTHLLFLDAFPM